MSAITGTFKEGRVLLDTPVDWPDGARVVVTPSPAGGPSLGLRESDWPDDAQGRAEWVAWYDTLEPLEVTEGEEAEIARARAAVRQASIEAVRRRMEAAE